MKKILVTGATGFIGNYVIEQLLEKNYIVIASSANDLKAREKSWFSRVIYKACNLELVNDHINYYDFFDKPDKMIHLAWEGLPNYKAPFHIEINLPRHQRFLENLLANGLKDLTVTGTCFEYGMKEGALTEDMPVSPANPYGIAKNNLRNFIDQLQKKYTFSFKWIRLFYMYGKGQSPKSLLSQLENALNNNEMFNMSGGEQIRDFLPVENVADYILRIVMQNDINGIINCCSGQPVTVKQFIEDYLKRNHKKIQLNLGYYPYPDYEPMHFWGDNTKLKNILHHE